MDTTQAVARILKMEGVEWISCFPSNQLIEAVAQEGIRTVMFRHERGAVMAADGYSRVNNRNKFGVIITQGGPGAENSKGGIAQAFADNVPILYLPGGPSISEYAIRPLLLTGAHISDGVKIWRSYHQARSSCKRNATCFPPPSQRTPRSRDRRDTERRWVAGGPGRCPQLQVAQARASGARSQRYQRCRYSTAQRRETGHLVRYGCAALRSDRCAQRVC